jgi:hypothetical protein
MALSRWRSAVELAASIAGRCSRVDYNFPKIRFCKKGHTILERIPTAPKTILSRGAVRL